MAEQQRNRRGGQPPGKGSAKARAKGAKPAQGGGKPGSQQGGREGQQQGTGGGRPKQPTPRDVAEDPVAALAKPLARVLDRLPETQRKVLELRMGLVDGHPRNLSETAKVMGMTMHEAKQVEQRAFEHIREVVPLGQLSKLLKG